MPDGIVNFMITVFRLYSRKNCDTKYHSNFFAAMLLLISSHFSTRLPSSLRTCQLRFQVRKLGVNFATKFTSSFQCLNFVSY